MNKSRLGLVLAVCCWLGLNLWTAASDAQAKKLAPNAPPATKDGKGKEPAAPALTQAEVDAKRQRLYFLKNPGDKIKLDVEFPTEAKATGPAVAKAAGSGYAWSKLAPAATLEKEIDRIVTQSAESLASDSVFTARGYKKIKDNHSLAAAWLHVLSDFDGPSKMKAEAAAVRDLASLAPLTLAADESKKPDMAMYTQAKGAQDALAKLAKGEKTGAPAGKARPWREVAIYTSVMKRMEAAQDQRIRVWTGNAEELGKNTDEVVHEAELLAVLCQIILDKGFDNAGDDTYQGWAKKLQQDCVELVAATKAKEADKAKALAGDIAKQCAACHEAYR